MYNITIETIDGQTIKTRYATIPSSWLFVNNHNGIDHYVRTDGADIYVTKGEKPCM